jgi:hypothetical protein
MNRTRFNPAELGEEDKKIFDTWTEKAEKAKQKAIENFDAGNRPVPFKGEVWSELKVFLLRVVFKGKCAYCDSKYVGTSFGDAEHFRPKGRVTEKKDGKDEIVMENGEPHPGYYWLAYDWHNLLPACERCNSAEGKMNQFPINKRYVFSREEGPDSETLDKLEEPLLLHPYREDFDPDAHLLYGDKGIIVAFASAGKEDIYGQAIINTCNLKRGELEADRYESQKYAWLKFKDAMNRSPDEMDKAITPYEAGELPHSRAAIHYVMLMWEGYDKTLKRLGLVKNASEDRSSPTP